MTLPDYMRLSIMPTRQDIHLGAVYIALAGTAIIYGGWHLLAKVAMNHGAPPLIFALYRCAAGSLLLLLAMWLMPDLGMPKGKTATVFGDIIQERQGYSRRDATRFLMLGTLMSGNVCGFIYGSSMLSALTCSIFQPTIPVVAAIIGSFCGVEEVSKDKFGALLLSVFGAVLVIVFGEKSEPASHVTLGASNVTLGARNATLGASIHHAKSESNVTLGALCIVMNVVCAGAYFVLLKGVLKTFTPVKATFYSYLHATELIFAAALCKHGFDPAVWLLNGDSVSWACLAYSAFGTTALCYGIQAWAIKATTPTTVTAFTTLGPISAAVLSFVFLGVLLTPAQAIGGFAIIIGLLLNIAVQSRESTSKEKKPLLPGRL